MRENYFRKNKELILLGILMLIPKFVEAKFNSNTLGDNLVAGNFVVLETLDTAAPTAPADLTATQFTGTAIKLSWKASTDDVGVAGYDIYNGDTLLVTVGAGTSYLITGVTELTTYSFTLKAKDAAGNISASSNVASITTPDIINLTISGASGTSVTLSWTPSTENVGVTGYDIYNKTTILMGTVDAATTTYTVNGLTQGTIYELSVRAKNAAGNIGYYSNVVNGKALDIVPPTAPTNLSATGATATTVNLSWTASTDSEGVTAYDIYKGGNSLIGTSPINTFTIAGLTPNNTYLFTVKARDAAGNTSIASSAFLAKTADTEAPTVPGNLITSQTTESATTLSWTASTDNEDVTGYSIYKNGNLIGNSTTTYLAISGLTGNTNYSFTVKAQDAAGNKSPESNAISVTTSPAIPTYCVSSGFSDMLMIYMKRVKIGSIDKYSGKANNCYGDYTNINTELKKGEVYSITINPYIVPTMADQFGKRYAVWIDFNGDKDFYDQGELIWNQTVTYQSQVTGTFTVPQFGISGSTRMRVTVMEDNVGIPPPCGNYSGTVTDGETEDYTVNIVDNIVDPQGPTAPTNLIATGTTWTTTNLSWTAPTGTTGDIIYEIYKENVLIGSSETTNYSVTGLNQATVYLFTVKAKNSNGNISASSIPVSVTTIKDQNPSTPSNLMASGTTATKTNLSWTASTNNSGNITYYVYESNTIRNNALIAHVSTPNCTVKSLMSNSTYTYTVKAVDSEGSTSFMSNAVTVTTLSPSTDKIPPTAPNLTAQNITTTSVDLSWSDSTDDEMVSSYDIYNGSTWIDNLIGYTNTYKVTGLTDDTNYTFTIKAIDVGGNSTSSNVVSVTTPLIPKYCSTGTTGGNTDDIYRVQIGSINNAATSLGEVSNYSNFTTRSTNLTPGQDNTFGIQLIKDNETDPIGIAVWIDLNNDKDFNDAGELVWSKIDASPSFSTIVGNFTIPITATIGQTRMRVSIKRNTIPTACEFYQYGEIEDYSVNIQKPIVDHEAPTVPTGFTVSGTTSSTTDLSWTASTDNIAVIGYDIYRDNILVGTSATTTYTVTGLLPTTTYGFTVKARDYAGNTSTSTNILLVTTLSAVIPIANFTAEINTVGRNGSIKFTDSSTNTPTSWSWEISRTGSTTLTSSFQNPTFTFVDAGTYTVKLTATNSAGSHTKTLVNMITVTSPTLSPIANFTAASTTVNSNGSIKFTDSSSNTPTFWAWEITKTGSTPLTSSLQSPTFTFADTGIYTVKLIVANSAGSNTKTVTNMITVTPPTLIPVANFSSATNTVLSNGSINFKDLSTNTPTSWAWEITRIGSTTLTSTLQNPTFTFVDAGIYTVKLTATNAAGSNTKTVTNMITVTPPTQIPVANFTSATTTVNSNGSIAFTDSSTNTPTSWAWEVTRTGSATLTSSLQNPTFIFVDAGTYTVKLTATNSAGSNTKTVANMITVTSPTLIPVSNFTSATNTVNSNESINFKDLSTNTPTSWAWEVTRTGSTTLTSTLQNPTFTFVDAGTYTVKLTVTNAAGSNTKTVTNMITVFISLPSNNFTVESKSETCANENNGEISITAKEVHTYVATINGKSYPFVNNSLIVSNLAPAIYNVSVSIAGEIFEQNFTINISKGATITARSSISSRQATVEMIEGTAPYTIFVNGEKQFETTTTSFSVDVNKGDLLEVKTAKVCEGIYSKGIDGIEGEGSVSAYPNPTSGRFEITLTTSRKEVATEIYNVNSQLISRKTYTVENGKIQLNIENQPTGVYNVKIYLDQPVSLKIIKN